MCSLGFDWEYLINGSDNDLAPNRRQAIIWTNDDPSSLLTYICNTRPTSKNFVNTKIWLENYLSAILNFLQISHEPIS